MAAEAACRLGRPVETLRFDQLDEHDQYDAVWASACLLHVPKADLQGVLARIWRALNLPGYSMRASRRATPMAATPSAVTTTILQKIWLKECYRDAGSWSFGSIDRSEVKVLTVPPRR
jgi:hypothetical protein